MSETLETSQAEMSDATASEAEPAPETTLEAPEGLEATEAPEGEQTPPEVKVDETDGVKKRFGTMTRKLSEKEGELQRLRTELQSAQELLKAGKPDGEKASTDIEAAVNERLAQREFDAKRVALVNEGSKQFGREEWQGKTEVLHGMGATQNTAFMQALVEMPNAAALVAHLADDPDELAVLLSKSPVSMAATMGRMAVALESSKTATAPAERVVSNAPKPVKTIAATSVVREPTVYDDKLTMAEYAALRAKTASRKLGGQGR